MSQFSSTSLQSAVEVLMLSRSNSDAFAPGKVLLHRSILIPSAAVMPSTCAAIYPRQNLSEAVFTVTLPSTTVADVTSILRIHIPGLQ
jgi:hypothetical protein